MRRLFRLVLLCLVALALPLQGATAAVAMASGHGAVAAIGEPAACPHHLQHAAKHPAGHTIERAGCGACCAPVMAEQPMLAIAPVAARWSPVAAAVEAAQPAQFLTSGPERPPRAA